MDQFEMFVEAPTKFFLKVNDAQLEFVTNRSSVTACQQKVTYFVRRNFLVTFFAEKKVTHSKLVSQRSWIIRVHFTFSLKPLFV